MIPEKTKNTELSAWKLYFFLGMGGLLFLAFVNGFILASLNISINSFYGELLWGLISAWLAVGGLSVVGDYSRRKSDRLGRGTNVGDL